jgi:hypothetical protein
MNKKEVSNLLGLAAANFPNMQEKDFRPTAVLWEKMLSDMPYQVAENALIRVLATTKYFPTVAEIREAAVVNSQPQIITAAEAYQLVLKAIHCYGSYREQEALESLDPLTRKVTEAIGWRSLCLSEEPDVIRGQWRKAYEGLEKRVTTEAKMPQALKQLTCEIGRSVISAPKIESQGTK